MKNNPMQLFKDWHSEALKIEENADAMSVATIDPRRNRPTSRMILFKGVDEGKIIFYTNYLSPKFLDIEANPEVSLNFYWHRSQKQVRIQGIATATSREKSKEYFASRDKISQIASSISTQSAPISSKDLLLKNFEDLKEKSKNIDSLPCPDHWGGVYVIPYEFEFFIYGEHRLNDRILYTINPQKPSEYEIQRLQP